MRIIFYTILVTVGLALSVIILVPSFFDINTYKNKLYKLVEQQTGYNLNVQGSVSISVFPRLNLSADNIILKNKNEILFKSKSLIVYPSISSFLKGNLHFDRIKLENPKVVIKKNEDKTYNWTITRKKSDLKKEEVSKSNKNPRKEAKKNYFIIKNLQLKNSSLIYSYLNSDFKIDNINLKYEENESRESLIKGSFIYNEIKNNFDFLSKNKDDNFNIAGNINTSFYKVEGNGNYNYNKNKGNFIIAADLNTSSLFEEVKYLKENNFKINAELDFINNVLNINELKILSNNNVLKGNARLNYAKGINNLKLNISSEELDINKFIDLEGFQVTEKNIQKQSKENEIKKNKNKSKNTTDLFDQLNNYNFNFLFDIKRVLLKDITFEKTLINIDKKKNIKASFQAQNFFNSKLSSNFLFTDKNTFSLDVKVKDLSLKDLNNYYDFDHMSGNLNLVSNLKGKIVSGKKIYRNIKGVTNISSKEVVIKNLNLKGFKEEILSLDNLSSINQIKNTLFNGSTKIKDQKITLKHDKEIIKIPLTKIYLGEDFFTTKGQYNFEKNQINLSSNYESNENKLLSLFNIETTGDISKPISKLTFDESTLVVMLEKAAEKKIKKILEDKLEKKFDKILDGLLE